MSVLKRVTCYFILITFLGGPILAGIQDAYGQSPGDINTAIQQQRKIIQQQEQQRRDRERELRQLPTTTIIEQKKQPELSGSGGKCLPIKTVRFDGADLLNKKETVRDTLIKNFIGKCLSVVDILTIVRVVSNWYIEEGYITARAWPPEQDLAKGTLTIKVLEGRTGSVEIYENGKKRKGADNAFPRIVGKRLYIRDIEQGLDQINRLASHNATIKIEPGKKDGFSKLRVDTERKTGIVTRTTFDNNGVTNTGQEQIGQYVTLNDFLGLYGSLTLGYQTSKPFDDDEKWSEDYTASLSIPFGYWTFFASGSYNEYNSRFPSRSDTVPFIDSSGNIMNLSAEIDRVIHRDRLSKTRLSGFINFKNTKSYVNDNRLDVNTRKLNILGARFSHSRSILGGSLNYGMDAQQGVPMFGSLKDPDGLASDAQKAEFFKFSTNFSFYRPFQIGKLRFKYLINGAGQWSDDTLFGSEQLSLGGSTTIRGFRDDTLSGDTGGYLRNEIALTLPNLFKGTARRIIGDLDAFAAYDVGWIKKKHDYVDINTAESGRLSGFATGLKLNGGMFYGQVAYEKALEAPDHMQQDNELVRFNAGMSFKW
ncbi:MAG: ShlB/FhaC/HecB family hemolysin secretion/activation protein [Methyloligellaceae bacterium]